MSHLTHSDEIVSPRTRSNSLHFHSLIPVLFTIHFDQICSLLWYSASSLIFSNYVLALLSTLWTPTQSLTTFRAKHTGRLDFIFYPPDYILHNFFSTSLLGPSLDLWKSLFAGHVRLVLTMWTSSCIIGMLYSLYLPAAICSLIQFKQNVWAHDRIIGSRYVISMQIEHSIMLFNCFRMPQCAMMSQISLSSWNVNKTYWGRQKPSKMSEQRIAYSTLEERTLLL